jgi:RNA polymerase sigma factor (sigma-70 family)
MADLNALFARLHSARAARQQHQLMSISAEIVSAHLHLIGPIARRYIYALDFEDAYQAGALGLYSAAAAFRADKGAFVPFARAWIRGSILQEVSRSKQVMVPHYAGAPLRTYALDAPGDEGLGLSETFADDDVADPDRLIALEQAMAQLAPHERSLIEAGLREGTPVPEWLVSRLRRLIDGD